MSYRSIVLGVAAATFAATAYAQSPDYTFTRLTDFLPLSQPLNTFPVGGFAINDNGEVAYSIIGDNDALSVFVTDGVTTTKAFDDSGPINSFAGPYFNNQGLIAGFAFLDGGGKSIVYSDASGTRLVGEGPFGAVNPNDFSLNDNGQLAFKASDASGPRIAIFDGASFSVVDGPGFRDLERPQINNAGQVVYTATRLTPAGVFESYLRFFDGTTASDIFGPFGGGFETFRVIGYTINDAGQIAWLEWDAMFNGKIRLFDGQNVTTIMDNLGPVGGAPIINNAGDILLSPSRFVINMLKGGAVTEVLRAGDVLDGRTIRSIGVIPGSFNNGGSIVMSLEFDGPVEAVYRADPVVLPPDADNDGVLDTADLCPGTVIPEAAPTSGKLGNGRYALTVAGAFGFTTGGKGANAAYDTADTAGCSCEQIVDELFLGEGQLKFGCSKSVMESWINGLPFDPNNP